MNKTIKFIALLTVLTVLSSMLTVFAGALSTDQLPDTATEEFDYDALFDQAYLINNKWDSSDLVNGSSLNFVFRNETFYENYDKNRHFSDFKSAYDKYLSTNPDIMTDVPVFIFAPGTYNSAIEVRYSAIILGSNAGINPNDTSSDWTASAMSNGWEANSARLSENETVFTGGIIRQTRTDGNNIKWAKDLEDAEAAAEEKAHIQFILDGIKITGSLGITQYDYSNKVYSNVNYNGTHVSTWTPTGNRTTTTSLINSVVDNYSGSGNDSLFCARCYSMNKNDVIIKNVRMTNITSSGSLFNKFFRDLTIDGLYYANNSTAMFGSCDGNSSGATFGGNGTTAYYSQNMTVKNSVFYKNSALNPFCFGNNNNPAHTTNITSGSTVYNANVAQFKKQVLNFTNNICYDALYINSTSNYWGLFRVGSKNTSAEFEANITNNIFHQSYSFLKTFVNGNADTQKSKTTINFNYNKVTGRVESLYPNTMDQSSSFVSTKLFYNFDYNFFGETETSDGKRSEWTQAPTDPLANGYNFRTAKYYIDYALTTLGEDISITDVSGFPGYYNINDSSIIADCTDFTGVITPVFTTSTNDVTVTMYSDSNYQNEISSIDLTGVTTKKIVYLTIKKGNVVKKATITIIMNGNDDITDISQLLPSRLNFPIININTTNNAPIVNKKDYVECGVSISNTDTEYLLDSKLAGIRYRGNSTFSYSDKKAYRIKFDKKQDLFGIGKAKNWVLLANAFDKTMVRNAIAFAIAQELGLDYTSEFRFVNVYINGKFQGVYLLCEQTQTGSTRVDVEEDVTGKINTGYLVEIAGNGKDDGDPYFSINEIDPSLFGKGVTKNWRVNTIFGVVKSPEEVNEVKGCSKDQLNYIANYVNELNKAILTQDMGLLNEIADVDSFAKFFVVNTILNNADAGYQMYVYKKEDGGKIYAGPVWDFDQSSASTTHAGDSYDQWYTGSQNPWFDSMSNWDEFLTIAKKYYYSHLEEIEEIISYYTTEFYLDNSYDFNANEVLWKSVSSDYWRITNTIKKLVTYEENFAHLEGWFDSRIKWLNKQYDDIYTAPTGISLNKGLLELTNGQVSQLTATLTPFYASDENLVWESSNDNIAYVDENGVVVGVSNGTAVITAKIAGTSHSATCNVRVFTVQELEGSITINDTYTVGDVITPSFQLNNPNCIHKIVWYRDSAVLGGQTGETYTVSQFDIGHTIRVEFIGTGDTQGTISSNFANIVKKTVPAPSQPAIANETADTVTLRRVTGYEYKMNDGEWQTSTVFSGIVPGNTYRFYQRVAETNTAFASESSEAKVYTAPKLEAGSPVAPTLSTTSIDSITLTSHEGYEYKVNGGEWQVSNVFTNLVLGNTYIFTQRIAETSTTNASAESTELSIKFIASNTDIPEIPAIKTNTATSVTLTSHDGYEYRVNGGEWQDSNVFENLSPNTKYSFEQRIKQTETHFASAISEKTYITLPKLDVKAPAAPTVKSTGAETVTLKPISGYEYRVNGGKWQKTNVFTGLESNTEYTFTQRIAETNTAYASPESASIKVRTFSGLTADSFKDVKSGSWYEEYVDTVVKYGIFNGISDTEFAPNANITRAMFVQALAKLDGANIDNSLKTKFKDVPAGKWFAGAVKWATDCGVVNGISENEFSPNANITREQMCAMLVRYANHKEIKLKTVTSKAKFSDDNKISSYAKESVYACQMAGIVNGMTETTFEPKGTATRAQIAKILSVFFEDYVL